MKSLYVVLDNVRSAHNVGSFFRTADGAGVTKIYLCGYTPLPKDRFGRARNDIKKAALGAEETVPWEHVDSVEECIRTLQKEGVTVVAVEQTETAIPYTGMERDSATACVFGNEVEGVSPSVLASSDSVVVIPMHGKKESLNVAVAGGIILFHFRESPS